MFNKEEIFEIMDKFEKGTINEMSISKDDFSFSLIKYANSCENNNTLETKVVTQTKLEVEETIETTEEVNEKDAIEGNIIASPLVGTFYTKPSPDSKPFVKVGDKVKKGDVICIIEAMKALNEIESDVDGEIVKILKKDEEIAEYGEALFIVR